jgi:ABC-2 type transport system ATP-binding protein
VTIVSEVDGCAAFVREISGHVGELDLPQAITRLLDLVHEYSDRTHEQEAIMLKADYASYAGQRRRRLRPDDEMERRRREIESHVLELASAVCSRHRQPSRPADAPNNLPVADSADQPADSTAADDVTHAAPAGAGDSHAPPAGTELELARAQFAQAKRTIVAPSDVALECTGLTKRFGRADAPAVVSGVTITMCAGEILGVLGENGAGKSTLLDLISGELIPTSGRVRFPEVAPNDDWSTIRQHLRYVRQVPTPWNDSLDDSLLYAAANAGLRGSDGADEVEWVVHRLRLDGLRLKKWGELSQGFKMRFAIARALVSRPQVLVLDEPLAPLDPLTQQTFLRDLRDLADSTKYPMAIVLSSQELYEVESIADQLLFLSAGRDPTFYGPPVNVSADRPGRVFELSGPRADAVRDALVGIDGLRIDQSGVGWIVNVPDPHDAHSVLRRLIQAEVAIRHFRDISSSSRRLFEEERRRW